MMKQKELINALFYTVAFMIIQFLASVLIMALLQVTGNGELLVSPYVSIASMVVCSVVTLAVYVPMGWAKWSKRYLMSRPWAVLFWSVMVAIGVVIPSMYVQEQLPELPNVVEAQMAEMMSVPGGYFVICLLAPLVEELVMRGAVLRALLLWKPERCWLMIVLSALLFAVIHMNPAQMPHAFAMGLLLGWMYVRTGSIVPGVAFHWANNTVAFVLYRLYPNPDLHLVDILGTNGRVLMAVGFSLCILLPALYQLWLRMRKP